MGTNLRASIPIALKHTTLPDAGQLRSPSGKLSWPPSIRQGSWQVCYGDCTLFGKVRRDRKRQEKKEL